MTSVGATLATLSPALLAALDSTGILGYLPERTAVRTREALIRRGLLAPVPRRGGTRYRLTDAGYDARSAIPVRVDTACTPAVPALNAGSPAATIHDGRADITCTPVAHRLVGHPGEGSNGAPRGNVCGGA